MLIKAVTRQGTPIPYTPEEALPFAVEYGVKSLNSDKSIYWVLKDTVKLDAIHYNQLPGGEWEAVAEGTASIGQTLVEQDLFMDSKESRFKVHYKPSKDGLGLPDITVLSFTSNPA